MNARFKALSIVLVLSIELGCRPTHTSPSNTSTSVLTANAVTRPTSLPNLSATTYTLRVRHLPQEVASPHLLLGNPSNATSDSSNRDNFLMVKPYFALAFNNSAGEPRWVSWRVCNDDLGSAPRKSTFASDDTLPDGFTIISTDEYKNCGFDRGHMCPHSDRAANTDMSYATFIMTNIVPQAPNNNRKCWAQLENYCRDQVRAGNRLYVIAGPVGQGGVGSNGPAQSISNGRVVVPAETWKVILVMPDKGDDDVSNVTTDDRVIAVDVPNDQTKCGEEWAGFRCSPAAIEAKTGLQFFSALPSDMRTVLENRIDTEAIASPKPIIHEHN